MATKHVKIEGAHQPQGPGHGWAHCTDRKAETFFVFGIDGLRLAREFKTRVEAEHWVADQIRAHGRHSLKGGRR